MDTTELDAAWAALSQPCGLPPSLQEAAKRARGQRFGVATCELLGDVAAIYSTDAAFCAVRQSDGKVITWGDKDWGADCRKVQADLLGDVACSRSP